jgi:hypothetical protein
VSFIFFSRFLEIRLIELQIDPQFESTIRPKALGYIPYGMRFTSTIEDLEEKHSGTLGDYSRRLQDYSKIIRSSLRIIQAFLRTFGLWNSGTLKEYSPRPSRLLEDILLDYKVLRALSYGHPRAHYPSGSWTNYYMGPRDYSTWATLCKMVLTVVKYHFYAVNSCII